MVLNPGSRPSLPGLASPGIRHAPYPSPGALVVRLGPRRTVGNRPLAQAIRVRLTRS